MNQPGIGEPSQRCKQTQFVMVAFSKGDSQCRPQVCQTSKVHVIIAAVMCSQASL